MSERTDAAVGAIVVSVLLIGGLLLGVLALYGHRTGQWTFVHYQSGTTSYDGAFNTSTGRLCAIATAPDGSHPELPSCTDYPSFAHH